MKRIIKSPFFLVTIISLLFLVIPFFWMKPNEIDLGGDSNRLYFYDPLHFLVTNSFYLSEVITLGNRSFWPQFYFLPYVSLLVLVKNVLYSPYLLISFFNGIKVSISFLSVYLIIKTILQNSYKEKKEIFLEIPSILSGLLYTTAPIIIGNYDKALISHDQIFLYPFCFYLILTYFTKGKFRYLLCFIALSLIFTANFSWASAPPLFAFFPLALVFLFLYVFVTLKKRINYLHLLIACFLFLGLHAFHIIPEAYSLLSPNSYVNQRVFSHNAIMDDLNYFSGILPLSKLSLNILLYAPFKQYVLFSIVPVFFLFLGLCFSRNKDKTLFLIGIFFLITLYLVTANITDAGIKLYTFFFYIPGSSMFRNFIGQWAFVFTFFYALLFGQAIYFLFKKINNINISRIIAVFIVLSLIATSWNFFAGGIVNMVLFQTNNVKIPIVMDPKYEQTLTFIRSLKDDGAFVSFPFTDSYETVIHGLNNGAYEGPSPIYWLTGKLDYNGYQQISPFGEIFFKLVKDKNYKGIKKLFGLLNIRYIYYNDDPKVYDKTFPGNPYNSARVVFPKTQAAYKNFIKQTAGKEIYHNGTYHIYKTDAYYFHPKFYIAEYLKTYNPLPVEMYTQNKSFFDFYPQMNDVFLDSDTCIRTYTQSICSKKEKQQGKIPQIHFVKINPTMYHVNVTDARAGYLLVFSTSFHNAWDISLTKKDVWQDLFSPNKIRERQIQVNGYANAWYILPQDVGGKSDYTLTLQLSDQKFFYIGIGISLITLLLIIIQGIFFLSDNNRNVTPS